MSMEWVSRRLSMKRARASFLSNQKSRGPQQASNMGGSSVKRHRLWNRHSLRTLIASLFLQPLTARIDAGKKLAELVRMGSN